MQDGGAGGNLLAEKPKRGRRTLMSAAQKGEVSRRMKAYWANGGLRGSKTAPRRCFGRHIIVKTVARVARNDSIEGTALRSWRD